MAEVFLAKVAGPGGFEKLVVLKRVLPQLLDDDNYKQMFLSEARLAAQLDHPNIVHVFDFGEFEGSYFLAMEYVDGANLRQVLRWAFRQGKPVATPLAARIISLACEGLAYAHEFEAPGGTTKTRLVHRDVSPENIMLSRTGAVKVLDFGVAKVSGEDNRSKAGSLKGKIAYMPPEQLRGRDVDHRVDIYALGVVLYQVLSGKRPYMQPTDVALITAILSDPPTPLMKLRLDLPDSILEVVTKAMDKDPARRFQTCLEMRDALEEFIAHSGTPTTNSQIAQLVTGYRQGNPEDGSARGGLASPGHGSSPSSSESGPDDAEADEDDISKTLDSIPQAPDPAQAGMIDVLMSEAARSNPQIVAPPEALGEEAPKPTTLQRPKRPATMPPTAAAQAAQVGLPRIEMPGVRPSTIPSMPAVQVPKPVASDAGPERAWASKQVAPEPIRSALARKLDHDRSLLLSRKLPAVIGRLTDYSRTIPGQIAEALGGAIDAAVLAEDHSAIVRIIERAESRPGRDRQYARLVASELQNPLRIAWLVERTRSGLPADSAGLRTWLGRLGPSAIGMLIDAVESSTQGPAQELWAEALAFAIPSDPSKVIRRLEDSQKRHHVAALCFALEKSQVVERKKTFQALMAKRDVALQVEVLTGRVRARGTETLHLLEGGLGDRSEAVRVRAAELAGEVGGAAAFQLLQRLMQAPTFESRSPAERAQYWGALLDCGGEAAAAEIDQVLHVKQNVLSKKKVGDSKMLVIDGLARAKSDLARALLHRTAADATQGEQFQAAARAALQTARSLSPEQKALESTSVSDRRAQLSAQLCLDLAMLARAATTVDLGSRWLDAAIERFGHTVRELIIRIGHIDVLLDPVPTLNGQPVSFGPFHAAVGWKVRAVLQARDLRELSTEAAVPTVELRSFLLRAFDPDGKQEVTAHLKVHRWSNRLLTPMAKPPRAADLNARSKEIFAVVSRWLDEQRDGIAHRRAIDSRAIDPLLDEWASLIAEGGSRFMGLSRWRPGDGTAEAHGVNTAIVAMAFTADLGLSVSAIREVCELSLMLALAESLAPADRRSGLEEPIREDQRFHAAGLLLTNRVNRLGSATAVAAIEAGLPIDASGKGGTGLLASIHALCTAYDALTAGAGSTPAQALDAINGRLKARFSADLLGLFTQWAKR